MKPKRSSATIGMDFTEGAIMPMLLRYFLPFLLANLLNSIYNTVDTIIVGQFVGSAGIVAVTVGGKMLNLFTNIGFSFAAGGQILIAQIVGEKRREEINSTIGTMFTEMILSATVAAGLLLLFSSNIVVWMNTPDESYDAALTYLRITSIGLPLIFGYNAVCAVLRGMGDSKSPLIYIAIAAGVNVIGDLFFVALLGMGAAGTAIATVMAQGIALLFSVCTLYKKREQFGFDFKWKSFKVDRVKLKIMVKIGFPMALRNICIGLTQIVLLGSVNLYGLAEATAYSIGDKFVHLANIFHGATTQAAAGMIGQNIGAGRKDRVKTIVRYSAAIALGAAVVLSLLSVSFPYTIFGLFTDDMSVLTYAPVFMRIGCVTLLLSSVMGALEAVVTGTGNSGLSFLSGLLDGVVFRISFSFLLAYAFEMGAAGFFMGDALARLGPILVGSIYYFGGAWKRRRKLLE